MEQIKTNYGYVPCMDCDAWEAVCVTSGCNGYGDTPEEAINALMAILTDFVEELIAEGAFSETRSVSREELWTS